MSSIFVCPDSGIWLPVFGIFNVLVDVDACGYTLGDVKHRKIFCTDSSLREKNPLLHRGIEPASVLCLAFRSNALPTERSFP